MPYRRLPNSIPTVLHTLITARDKYKSTADAAARAMTAAQWEQLRDTGAPESLFTKFERECGEVDTALAVQGARTTEVSQKGARATLLVSHFHQVFDLAVARGAQAANARRFYGRDITATELPPLRNFDAVEKAAKAIVKGEAERAAAEGAAYVAMANPSAAEVAAALEAFKTARTLAQTAQEKTDLEREDAGALYPAAQALAVDICDTVEFFYRNDPSASSRRAKCRRWGVVYVFAEGETPDPEPGPGGGGGNPPAG